MSFSRTKDCLLESELPPGAENAEEQRPPLDQTGKSLSHPSEEGARQSLEREAVSCWSQCFPEGAGFSEAQKQVVTPRLNNINSLCLSRLRKNPKPVKDEMKPKNVISRCKRTSTGSNTLKMSKKQRNFHQIRVRTLTPMMFKGQLFIYIYKERELLKWREKVKAGAQDIGSVKETILREEVRNERLQVKNPLRSMENSSPKRPAERTAARNTRSQALKLPMHPAGTKIAFPSWLPCEFPISTSDLASQPKLKSFIYFYEVELQLLPTSLGDSSKTSSPLMAGNGPYLNWHAWTAPFLHLLILIHHRKVSRGLLICLKWLYSRPW
ncbi:uncharacterized protein LOC106730093 isoform X6 [Camelus ferus]|uniref:Uncharacterized protein LOC106730093 isoform X6 n=1 Tax=Camelus ferus TaxID=419612 RepID=A0A8B8SVF6_CAMFR|nr:uncharacterized protein LOC106730093 isoform X6 [Camelus ferus]